MPEVAIIGAPGYAGVELTRLVLGHPDLSLAIATSETDRGRRMDEVYPAFSGTTDLVYSTPTLPEIAEKVDVVFLAVPHTAALALVPALLDAGLLVIDASADYRLKDAATYERWYGVAHTSPELLQTAAYGLPELGREQLRSARLIACPGCYPTATLLAAAPALEAGIVDVSRIVVDAKSGVSGAGRKLSSVAHFSSANESVHAYSVGTHRHTPEIEQELSRIAGAPVKAVFAPHLVPMTRGLLSTVYLELTEAMDAAAAVEVYRTRYEGEPFVTVHPVGVMPATREVSGSNRAHIGVVVDESGMLVVTCAIDNLVKGTSGQAVQCANIALGLPETDGLTYPTPVV